MDDRKPLNKEQLEELREFLVSDPHLDAPGCVPREAVEKAFKNVSVVGQSAQRLYPTNKPRRLTRAGVIGPMMREIWGVLYQGDAAQGVEDLARAFR